MYNIMRERVTMENKDRHIIRCPKCGAEYLPSEIMYPESLLGRETCVSKDSDGHIIFSDGEAPSYSDEYTCDYCGCTFDVKATVSYSSEVDSLHDFSRPYETKLHGDRMTLKEPSGKADD